MKTIFKNNLVITTPEELETLLRNVVFEAIQGQEQKENKEDTTLHPRNVVKVRLHKDNATLWRWDKTGYLPAVRIGRCVYYRECDIRVIESNMKAYE